MNEGMSDNEREDLRRGLEAFCKAMSEHGAKRRWLFTFRSADGAERHLSYQGNPPREYHLPLMRTISFREEELPIEKICLATSRRYVLHSWNSSDGTALYREDLP